LSRVFSTTLPQIKYWRDEVFKLNASAVGVFPTMARLPLPFTGLRDICRKRECRAVVPPTKSGRECAFRFLFALFALPTP
jgi:hypothetical protein